MIRLEGRIRSISYLKAHAAELLRDLADTREPWIVTQNGEARAVLLDVATYDQLMETAALGKLVGIAERQIEDGMVQDAADALTAFADVEG